MALILLSTNQTNKKTNKQSFAETVADVADGQGVEAPSGCCGSSATGLRKSLERLLGSYHVWLLKTRFNINWYH